jgi:UDP-N-acetylmuramoyl-tripeptide--D-alanyl-D-alanine ligase
VIATPIADIAGVLGATVVGDPTSDVVTADVEVDSRLVAPGGLFVALPGERTDGHEHAPAAVALGAVAAVVERALPEVPCLVVPDSLAALQVLAKELWSRRPPLTFGITGSSGKTSTKDLLAQLLAHYGPTLAPTGSFNNEVGLPLTALRRSAATRLAVLEFSSRGVGHIRFLADLVRPDVAIVLNVGSAHLGEFGSAEAIAEAKGELVEAAGAHVVLNAADPRVRSMATRTAVPITLFGEGGEVWAEGVRLDRVGRPSFRLHASGGSAPVQLRLHGEHQVSNALAAAAAALSSGVADDVSAVADQLGSAVAQSRWRMEVTDRPDGVTVVNDAYNANPESMRAALGALDAMSDGHRRRTVAVLGPMAELGESTRERHVDLGRLVGSLGIDQLLVVGAAAHGIHDGALAAGARAQRVADVPEAIDALAGLVRPDDVVLVKASRSAGLEKVAEALLEGGS